MNALRFRRLLRREIDTLRREELLSAAQHQALLDRYPATTWDWSSLGRWFLIFGAISAATGLLTLGSKLFEPTLENLAIGLGVVIVATFAGAWRLGLRSLVWSGRALELLGGLAIIGLTFTLGVIYSSGSGNWPALLLVDLIILVPLAYALRNVLLLILSVVVFFTWFGGVTGYVSGWGAYFFGMNYPVRFLIAGLLMIGFAWLHRSAETGFLKRYDGFFKTWLSGGMFFSEMSLWLTSLFGNYGDIFSGHLETALELLLFNVLWAGFNVVALLAGARFGLRMLRGYAITFLIIHAYTLYFWHVAEHLGGVLATFVAGAATLGLVVHFERSPKSRQESGTQTRAV